jgi:uncharacterized heparinase superfamily protein
MVENYLDLYNLVSNNSDRLNSTFIELLRQYCEMGLKFYQAILFPDQKFPLFNDSAFYISPSYADLNTYHQRLFKRQSCTTQESNALIALKESGLFGYRSDQDMFILTAGDIGPHYQPGHTHCHLLSYELMLSGQRVVVDSGVYEYEPGPMRQYVRSTCAHNTVMVDDEEQSEVWGEFRMARRAKVLNTQIEKQNDCIHFEGLYQGFPAVKGNIFHNRKVKLKFIYNANITSIHIEDIISGMGNHKVKSFIHLHPDISLKDKGNGRIELTSKKNLRLQLYIDEGIHYNLEDSFYCPEFGKKIVNQCLVLHADSNLPCRLSYSLKRY